MLKNSFNFFERKLGNCGGCRFCCWGCCDGCCWGCCCCGRAAATTQLDGDDFAEAKFEITTTALEERSENTLLKKHKGEKYDFLYDFYMKNNLKFDESLTTHSLVIK